MAPLCTTTAKKVVLPASKNVEPSSNTVSRYNVPFGAPTTRLIAESSTLRLLPKPENSVGYGLVIVCVQTKVSNPKLLNVDPTVPGATCSLLNSGAASEFLTLRVSRPVGPAVAKTFGTVVLIAVARLDTVAATGTSTSMLLILIVLPAVSVGPTFLLVIVP